MQRLLASLRILLSCVTLVVETCAILALVIFIFAPLECLTALLKARLSYKDRSIDLGWYFVDGVAYPDVRGRAVPPAQVLLNPPYEREPHTGDDSPDRRPAAMAPFIDRVFGTFYLPASWPARHETATSMPDVRTGQSNEPFAMTVRVAA